LGGAWAAVKATKALDAVRRDPRSFIFEIGLFERIDSLVFCWLIGRYERRVSPIKGNLLRNEEAELDDD
jgi:hypothetical protein